MISQKHGGRIDIWRRIKAFASFGVKLQLIYWSHNSPEPQELAEMEKYIEQVYLIPFKRTPLKIARRIIDLFSYPYEMTTRIPRGQELTSLLSQVKEFNPDLIFLDGIQGSTAANELSKNLNLPIVTRSHNIEHLYQQQLLQAATGWRKLKKQLYLTNLEQYEENALRNSAFFYDISVDDLKFWQERGLNNGRYLPPLMDWTKNNIPEPENKITDSNFDYDIVYFGGLGSDNNVEGIVWFLTNVVPLIQQKIATVTILIAGFAPFPIIKQLCSKIDCVELRVNPSETEHLYRSGRVLINPVSAGSGVNIKSIEMLVSQRPIVSRNQGVSGLPQELKKYFIIANDEQSFAEAIINCLSTDSQTNNIEPEILNSFFGPQAIKNILEDFESIL